MQLFLAKMSNLWREMLIKEYISGNQDTLAKRVNFLKRKLAEWCNLAALQNNYKISRNINKRTHLYCKEIDLPAMIENKPQRQKNSSFRYHHYDRSGKGS